jgi:hypothetical protein
MIRTIPNPQGIDGTDYIIEDGNRVTVSRHVLSTSTISAPMVETAVRNIVQDAKSTGKPLTGLSLTLRYFGKS